ncbi:MAG: SEC-C metal-binding domain-containing protein, partial [Elusimicrobia bacterium]|nr:SEC-C metal-binding domain-containing protein [Elusimicrobiota bacterium]
ICIREDFADLVYKTEREKFNAIVGEIEEHWKKSQPMLVGTRSIEKSEKLSAMLRAKGIPHQVLNAKYHEMEAQIIAQAGRKGAVTIATNMAGRGTDIVLGGNPPNSDEQKSVIETGGLYVLGTERHEARRIDNQLRGRCARQGDPGRSKFYLALDDELMRLFGSDRITGIMEKLGMEEGEAIESGLLSRQIEVAQRRVEAHNFDIRKHLLDYDKVMNQQRSAIYSLRNAILDGAEVSDRVMQMIDEVVEESFGRWAAKNVHIQLWDLESLTVFIKRTFGIEFGKTQDELDKQGRDALIAGIRQKINTIYQERTKYFQEQGVDFKEIERMLMLQIIDQAWKNHLYELDHLKKSVGLRAYGQKDPLIEYQRESFGMYQGMLGRVRDQVVDYIFKVQLPPKRHAPPPQTPVRSMENKASEPPKKSATAVKDKIGRNDPCPCGSGKKYKKCCGQNG